jgi:anti-anti-sigma factor
MDRPSGHELTITLSPRTTDDRRVSIAGDLDMSSGDYLRDALTAARGASASTRLRLDLSQVTFLDCATITTLIRQHRDAAHHGGTVAITAASPIVDHLLNLFDLGPTFSYPAAPAASLVPVRRSWWRPQIRRQPVSP